MGPKCRNLIVDASKYTTGRVTGTVDFDPGPGVLTSVVVVLKIFVSKLNAAAILFGQSK
jgi:hypothetical protein